MLELLPADAYAELQILYKLGEMYMRYFQYSV